MGRIQLRNHQQASQSFPRDAGEARRAHCPWDKQLVKSWPTTMSCGSGRSFFKNCCLRSAAMTAQIGIIFLGSSTTYFLRAEELVITVNDQPHVPTCPPCNQSACRGWRRTNRKENHLWLSIMPSLQPPRDAAVAADPGHEPGSQLEHGYSWQVDDGAVDDFLILGAEGGTYYIAHANFVKQTTTLIAASSRRRSCREPIVRSAMPVGARKNDRQSSPRARLTHGDVQRGAQRSRT